MNQKTTFRTFRTKSQLFSNTVTTAMKLPRVFQFREFFSYFMPARFKVPGLRLPSLLILLQLLTHPLFSQTEIPAGTVSGTWEKASSPYYINGEVTVQDGETLTIEPGVEVLFRGHYKLNVQGRLLAVGNETDSIRFSTAQPWIKWHGIRFDRTPDSNDTSKIKFSIIENGNATGTDDDRNGGGICVYEFNKLKLTNSILKNNKSEFNGGGVYIYTANIYIGETKFINNSTTEGGGIDFWYAGGLVEKCIFLSNSVSNLGGAIGLSESSPSLFNNIFVDNKNTNIGGAINCQLNSNPFIVNNIFFENKAKKGGGISFRQNGKGTLINNIVYSNVADSISNQIYFDDQSSNPVIIYNNIEGGINGFSTNGFKLHNIFYNNNISENPSFKDPENFDFNVLSSSRCINSGIIDFYGSQMPELDLNNNSRISDGRIDIGAYEYQNASGNLIPRFTLSDSTSDVFPVEVQFNDISDGNPTTWEWDFGDGDTDTLQHPSHVYTEPGIYDISLTVRTDTSASTLTIKDAILIAADTISGNVSGIWDKDLYIATGEIMVNSNDTLQINPGTEIKFDGHFKFTVYGKLILSGTKEDSITFTTTHPNIKWKGLRFDYRNNETDSIFIDYCVFENGYANGPDSLDNFGGGVHIDSASYFEITNSVFRYNKAGSGGGIAICNNSNGIIKDCIISNNSSFNFFGGGGIYSINSNTIISSNDIYDNYSINHGGGIYADGSEITIFSNRIYQNLGYPGGGIQAFNRPKIMNNLLYGNTDCGIRASDNTFIRNNTIVYNTRGFSDYGGAGALLINNLIYYNDDNIYLEAGGDPDLYYNCIQNGINGIGEDLAGDYSGQFLFNKDADPRFVKLPSYVNGTYNFDSANFSLQATSPCINAGTPDTSGLNLPLQDMAGNPRITGDTVDIGAYEVIGYDLGIAAWNSPRTNCNLTGVENVEVMIKNFGTNKQWNFQVSYSTDGGQTFLTETITDTLYGGESMEYTFLNTADFNALKTYPCLAAIFSVNDNNTNNDTLNGISIEHYELDIDLGEDISECIGEEVTLGVSPNLGTYEWTGGTSATHQLTVTSPGTYGVKVTDARGCSDSSFVNVELFEYPGMPTAGGKIICKGGNADTLTANGKNIRWYSDEAKTVLDHEGNIFPIGKTEPGTYTWYVTQTINGCEGDATSASLSILQLPQPPEGEDAIICYGEPSPVLSVTGGNINWYADGLHDNHLATGNTYTPDKTLTGTYSFYATQSNIYCESENDTIQLTIHPLPVIISELAIDETSCNAADGSIVINATGAAPLSYSIDGGKTYLQNGGGFNDITHGSYPVMVKNGFGCTLNGENHVITSSDAPLAPAISQDTTYCTGEQIQDLQAIPDEGGTIIWYSNPDLTGILGSGQTRTPALTLGTSDYYATQTVDACESPLSRVRVTINQTPDAPSLGNDTTYCTGEDILNLVAGGETGATIRWFADEGLNESLGEGSTYAPDGVPGTTTYYATQTMNNCTGSAAQLSVTIHETPPVPLASGDTVYCSNEVPAPLIATPQPGASIQWYGNLGHDMPLATGDSLYPADTIGTTTYYVTQKTPYCESPSHDITVTVKLSPEPPVAESTYTCLGEAVPGLTATGSNIRWYDNALLSELLFEGGTFDTGKETEGAFTYYATQTDNGCESKPVSVSLDIYYTPPPQVSDTSVCYGQQNPDLKVTGDNIRWYTGAEKEHLLAQSSTYTPGMLSTGTYTYYVTQTLNNCESQPMANTFAIQPLPMVSISKDRAICRDQTGELAIGANKKQGHSYSWSSRSESFSSSDPNPEVLPLQTTTYILTETIDSTGCSNKDSVVITVNPLPDITLTASDNPIQVGGSTTLTASGGGSYTWGPPGGLDNTTGENVTASPLVNVTYTVTGRNMEGCMATDSLLVQVYCTDCERGNVFFDAKGQFDHGCTENNYNNNASCSWLLAPSGAKEVYLYIDPGTFDILTGDQLTIYDGQSENDPLIGQFDNDNPPPTRITSSGNKLFVTLTSDDQSTGRGFRAKYGTDLDPNNILGASARKSILAFPNPSNGRFTLLFESYRNATLDLLLYNATGALVHAGQIDIPSDMYKHGMNIQKLNKGMYWLKVTGKEGVFVKKVIVE